MEIIEDKHTALVPIILGITGHRDISPENIPILIEKIKNIFNDIQKCYKHTPLILLTPLAEGADRMAARAALEMGVKLYVPLPMPSEEYIKDFQSDYSKQEFKDLLSKADSSFELPNIEPLNNNENYYISNRNLYYEQLGAYIAKHSQVLIALWDGVDTGRRGGTSEVIKFKLQGIPEQYLFYDDPLAPLERNPVYHIVTPRISNSETREIPFTLHKYYPGSRANDPEIEKEYLKILQRTDIFNKDSIRLSPKLYTKIEEGKNYILPSNERKNLTPSMNKIISTFSTADQLAIYFQRWRLSSLKNLLLFGVLLVSLFLFYDELESNLMLLFYIAAFILAYTLYFIIGYRDLHNKHLDYRALAEGLRVQFYWKLGGLRDEVAHQYMREQRSELEWIRNAIMTHNLNIKELINDGADLATWKRFNLLLEYWVKDQYKYFQKTAQKNRKKLIKQNMIMNTFFILNIVTVIAVTYFEYKTNFMDFNTRIVQVLPAFISDSYFRNPEVEILIRNLFKIFTGIIAALIAVAGNYMDTVALSEQSKRNFRMYQLYLRAYEYLQRTISSMDLPHAERIVSDLGREALMENGEWVLLFRERPIEVPK